MLVVNSEWIDMTDHKGIFSLTQQLQPFPSYCGPASCSGPITGGPTQPRINHRSAYTRPDKLANKSSRHKLQPALTSWVLVPNFAAVGHVDVKSGRLNMSQHAFRAPDGDIDMSLI